MIYKTFKNAADDFRRARNYESAARESLREYITAVLQEVHCVQVKWERSEPFLTLISGYPTFITTDSDDKVTPLDIGYLTAHEYYQLAKQLHDLHLVKEWGDPDEPADTADNNQEQSE